MRSNRSATSGCLPVPCVRSNETIADFRKGQDLIEIISGAASFAGLEIEQDGVDVQISFGTGNVRIVTDNAGAFDEADFIF